MKCIYRVMVLLVVLPAIFYFTFWMTSPLSLFFVLFSKQRWIMTIIPLLCTVYISWYIWKKLSSPPSDLISSILLGGIILGAISFCAGFFGPIIFAPTANQCPLLGIFLTGPLGFLLGAVGGFIYWRIHNKKKENK